MLGSPGLFVAASITVAESLHGEPRLEPSEGNSVLVFDAGGLRVRRTPLSGGRKR